MNGTQVPIKAQDPGRAGWAKQRAWAEVKHGARQGDGFYGARSVRQNYKLMGMEGWTLLSALAMITDRLRLGILATGNTYRNPALVAKIATTLDHISGGRVELGLDAAWYEQEHTAYGWDFPSLRERSDRLEEATQLIRLLLTKDPEEYVNYSGKYYQLNDAPMSPRTRSGQTDSHFDRWQW